MTNTTIDLRPSPATLALVVSILGIIYGFWMIVTAIPVPPPRTCPEVAPPAVTTPVTPPQKGRK